jgi:hypothetical protein
MPLPGHPDLVVTVAGLEGSRLASQVTVVGRADRPVL